ncbi:MAG: hypothetical protein QF511_05615 [Rhodospirillales bacterium]|nr:hypothetical protein [Rhodospirillales bacterium]
MFSRFSFTENVLLILEFPGFYSAVSAVGAAPPGAFVSLLLGLLAWLGQNQPLDIIVCLRRGTESGGIVTVYLKSTHMEIQANIVAWIVRWRQEHTRKLRFSLLRLSAFATSNMLADEKYWARS